MASVHRGGVLDRQSDLLLTVTFTLTTVEGDGSTTSKVLDWHELSVETRNAAFGGMSLSVGRSQSSTPRRNPLRSREDVLR